jgi:hypothetical protein
MGTVPCQNENQKIHKKTLFAAEPRGGMFVDAQLGITPTYQVSETLYGVWLRLIVKYQPFLSCSSVKR